MEKSELLNDIKRMEELKKAARETTASDELAEELLRRRESGEDCTDVLQALIDPSVSKVSFIA
jgi:hypothetical protein